MNKFLMEEGIDVVESDLGERILQLMHLTPSHIVLPAIHVKREQISEMMTREMGTEPGNSDPTYLTHAARKNLREKFLHADAAMTGVNFAVASTGEIVVCTNEGNADMGTSFPKVHIAVMGMEKIVPNLEALGVFTRLLARSGTGQPITSYTAHYRRPPKGQEFHIIIVDNGRSDILASRFAEILKCLRCGACMNRCPVFRLVGGHAYRAVYPGPLGIVLSPLLAGEEFCKYADLPKACSLCGGCAEVCPAKIPLPSLIVQMRDEAKRRLSKPLREIPMGIFLAFPRTDVACGARAAVESKE